MSVEKWLYLVHKMQNTHFKLRSRDKDERLNTGPMSRFYKYKGPRWIICKLYFHLSETRAKNVFDKNDVGINFNISNA